MRLWDDATEIIWVFDASGPPPDSIHALDRFTCGMQGTADEHIVRRELTSGLSDFIGMRHTHPKWRRTRVLISVEWQAWFLESAKISDER